MVKKLAICTLFLIGLAMAQEMPKPEDFNLKDHEIKKEEAELPEEIKKHTEETPTMLPEEMKLPEGDAKEEAEKFIPDSMKRDTQGLIPSNIIPQTTVPETAEEELENVKGEAGRDLHGCGCKKQKCCGNVRGYGKDQQYVEYVAYQPARTSKKY